MITFDNMNTCGELRKWNFNNARQIEDIWRSNDCDIPANDDPIINVVINGKPIFAWSSLEEPCWFEDLLTFLGIEIWG